MTESAAADTELGVDGPAGSAAASNLLGSVPVVLVVGAGLAVAARAGTTPLLVAVAVAQAVFALAWVFGTGMPGRKGAVVVAALAAAAADVTVSVWPHGRLGTELAVLGLALPTMFVHQLARGTARRQIVSSLSGATILVVGVVALPALVQLRHEFDMPSGVTTGTADGGTVVSAAVAAVSGALLVGYLVDVVVTVPRLDADVPRGLPALIASIVVGGAVAYLGLRGTDQFRDGRSVFVGAALGVLAALLGVAAAYVEHTTPPPTTGRGRALRPVLATMFPLCLLAPVAFLLCLAIRF